MCTDEDEAFVGFGGAFHAAEELRHQIHRWDIFQTRRASHSSSSSSATANADIVLFSSALLWGFDLVWPTKTKTKTKTREEKINEGI